MLVLHRGRYFWTRLDAENALVSLRVTGFGWSTLAVRLNQSASAA